MTTLREQVEEVVTDLEEVRYHGDREWDTAYRQGWEDSQDATATKLRRALEEPEQYMFNRSALALADLAFIEAKGTTADRVKYAILGYLFALNSRQRFGDGYIYPSLDAMREHFATLREQAAVRGRADE